MTDRARLEKALVAADKAGDTQAAKQLASALRNYKEPQAEQPATQPATPQGRTGILTENPNEKPVGDLYDALIDPIRTMGSSMVAGPVAGVAGIAGTALPGKEGQGANWVENTQQALTVEPRTKTGELTTRAVGLPFELLAKGGDLLGQKAAEATGSPLIGSLVNTATQAGPAALFPWARGKVKALREQPKTAPNATPSASPEQVAAQRAQEYVTRSVGMDWASLPREAQKTLTAIAGDAKRLDALDPAAVKRQLELQSLPVPVPATRGDITRDPVQLRNESNVAATEAGAPIRQIKLDANQALLDNLEVLKGRVANKKGGAQTPEQVGLSVQDAALREKLKLKKSEVSAKYKAAEEAGELQGKVSPARLIHTVANAVDKTAYTWVDSWMKANNVVSKTEAGTVTRKLTLKEMEALRQEAVSKAMDGGSEGYHAGKIIKAIDDATEGAGGKLYKDARKARKEQAMEFEETGSVARLVDNKSRTDRATALEDTWRKTVVGGSIQDLRNVKRSLLTGGDAKTRTAGKRAWRDVKAQTIQHIQNEATKGVALNERGVPNVTPAAMKRAIDSIGKDKLNEIFGEGTAVRLDRILEATRTVKTVPPALHGGSSTMGNVLAFLERRLSRIPVVGDVGAGAIKAGVKLKEMGQAGRVVRESQQLPVKAPKRNKLAELQDF